jgi:hypothetical protein
VTVPRRRVSRSVIALSLVVIACGACSGGDGSQSRARSPGDSSPATGRATAATTTVAPPTSPDQLRAPLDAPATAAELIRTERALRRDGPDPPTRLALGWAQQLAYGALSSHPEWLDAVMAALPDDVAPIVRANHDAAVHLTNPNLGPTPASLPDWTIRTPPPPGTLLADYREAEAQSGVPWTYLAAIHLVETRMGRIHGNSGAGAQGPMQFVPSTWTEYGNGGNIDDDHDAILAAGRFLADHGGAGDISRALFAYNPSDDYVAAIEDYAGVMTADPRAYDGYYAWQVYVTTTAGTQRLPEGWHRP